MKTAIFKQFSSNEAQLANVIYSKKYHEIMFNGNCTIRIL